eukprot:GFYU01005864.1.p1 GENE.GFYU01005864.1~~GFYU01005864.1.p1  ORF type:complete len:442 (-),score=92.80 GFYU01005864.1:38-1363(-)
MGTQEGSGNESRKKRRPNPVRKEYVVALDLMEDETLVSLQDNGLVRLWEMNSATIARHLDTWRRMTGAPEEDSLRMEYESSNSREASSPKHGKEDPSNDPHVGGNQWAGGTGGADTAGLGGKGGPYRLDKGHDVHQISDEEKANISDEALEQARKMGKEALSKRLEEIQMHSNEAAAYFDLLNGVKSEVSQLRVVLESVQARGQERQWLRHQTSGDLDDTKLVDGITGEQNIYRRRTEADPTGMVQDKPKRMTFVMDISGSMYRFNGYDGRLENLMQTAVMIMESLHGFDQKYEWSMVGHSGDSEAIPLVEFGKPPKNEKERFAVCQTMHAHAQYCWSGDHTVEAIETAISTIAEKEADDYMVIAVSDANLRRYGIAPREVSEALTKDPKVSASIIFIGSLFDEAKQVQKAIPAGKCFVCLDTAKMPTTFKDIFTSRIFRD